MGIRITLTIEPDEKLWGFEDAIKDCDTTEEEIETCIELANEDIVSLLDEAIWEVTFDVESKG